MKFMVVLHPISTVVAVISIVVAIIFLVHSSEFRLSCPGWAQTPFYTDGFVLDPFYEIFDEK